MKVRNPALKLMETTMVFRSAFLSLLVASMVLWSSASRTADAAWINEMPQPSKVLEKFQGADAYDAMAQQAAALEILTRISSDMIGTRAFRNDTTPEERQLVMAYGAELARIQAALIESLPPAERTGSNSRRAKWFSLRSSYSYNQPFKDALLAMFFSQGFQTDLALREADAKARSKAATAMMTQQPIAAPGTLQASAAAERRVSRTREFIEKVVPAQWQWATNSLLWLAAFGALFVWGAARSAAPFRLQGEAPVILGIGPRSYTLNHRVGIVTDLQRWGESVTTPTSHTVTHSDGRQSTTYGSHTQVTNRIQVMMRDAAGRTHDVQLRNLDLAVAIGQGLATVWIPPKGKDSGPIIMLHNFDLARTQYMPHLDKIVQMPYWPGVALAGAVFCTSLPWWSVFAVLIGYAVVIGKLNQARARKFRSDIGPKIIAGLPKPPEGIVLPGGGFVSPG